jgi:hypothetical protein
VRVNNAAFSQQINFKLGVVAYWHSNPIYVYMKIDVYWCASESLSYTSSPADYVYDKATQMTMIDHWMYDHWFRLSNSDGIYCPVNYYEIRMADGNQNYNSNWL